MRLRPMIVAIFLCTIPILASLANGQTHPQVNITSLSGPLGTGIYTITTALEDISRKYHPWLRINNVETPGLLFNLKKLNEDPKNKRNMVIGSGSVVGWLAQNGMKPFDKKYPPTKALGNFFLVSTWLTTLNPKIKGGPDLVGKKIALGRAAQVNWGLEPDWIINYGWGIRDKVSIQFMGPKEAATALLDGLADVAIAGAYVDPVKMKVVLSPQLIGMMASGRKIYFVPWGEEAVKKVIAKGLPIVAFKIPGNTIKGHANESEALPVFTDDGCWMVDPEFPEEIAYEFVKLIINNISKFAEYTSLGTLMSTNALIFGLDPNNIHAGALKAYKEANILK